MPEGGQIHIRVLGEQSFIKTRIRDSGPGIPDAGKERIFMPYCRGNTSDKAGLGLGLAINKEIIEKHENNTPYPWRGA